MHTPKNWRKLTKKDAILICMELWDWLGDDRTATHKTAWPRWRRNGGNVPEMQMNCPCCEYVWQTRGDFVCSDCPISKSLWGGATAYGDTYCEYYKSPYKLWSDAKTDKTKNKYARQVAALARKALEQLNV